jgi:hypothetical protein
VGRGLHRGRGGGGARGGRRQSPTLTPPPLEITKTSLSGEGVDTQKIEVNANGIGGATSCKTPKTEGTNSACDKDEVFLSFLYLSVSEFCYASKPDVFCFIRKISEYRIVPLY